MISYPATVSPSFLHWSTVNGRHGVEDFSTQMQRSSWYIEVHDNLSTSEIYVHFTRLCSAGETHVFQGLTYFMPSTSATILDFPVCCQALDSNARTDATMETRKLDCCLCSISMWDYQQHFLSQPPIGWCKERHQSSQCSRWARRFAICHCGSKIVLLDVYKFWNSCIQKLQNKIGPCHFPIVVVIKSINTRYYERKWFRLHREIRSHWRPRLHCNFCFEKLWIILQRFL